MATDSDDLLLAHFDLNKEYKLNDIRAVLKESVGLGEKESCDVLTYTVRLLQRAGIKTPTLTVHDAERCSVEAGCARTGPLFVPATDYHAEPVRSHRDRTQVTDRDAAPSTRPLCAGWETPRIRCKQMAVDGVRYCDDHHTRALACFTIPGPATKIQNTPVLDNLRFIARIARTEELWSVDAEFTQFVGNVAVAWSLCIRRVVDDHILISCTMSYNDMDWAHLIETVKQGLISQGMQLSDGSNTSAYNAFARAYGLGGRATGLTFSQIRSKILELGFNPNTHALLSYGINNVDMAIMWKVFTSQDDILVLNTARKDFHMGSVPYTCMNPVSIQYILQKCMVSIEQKPKSFALKDVALKLFGRGLERLHIAENDTKVLNDVIRVLARVLDSAPQSGSTVASYESGC